MAEKITRVKNLVDTRENWETANPILLKGEIGLERVPISSSASENYAVKIGDGMTAWKRLPYIGFCSGSNAPSVILTKTEYDAMESHDNSTIYVVTDGSDTYLYLGEKLLGQKYELPTASADTLGGVKVGDNLSVDSDGKLTVVADDALSYTSENFVQNKAVAMGGNKILKGLNSLGGHIETNGNQYIIAEKITDGKSTGVYCQTPMYVVFSYIKPRTDELYADANSTACNLFDTSTISNASGVGITRTNNSDGSISYSGTATTITFQGLGKQNLTAGTYTFSGHPTKNPSKKYSYQIYKDNEFWKTVSSDMYTDTNTFKFDVTDAGLYAVGIYLAKNAVVDDTFFSQLEKGTVAHDYVNYTGTTGNINSDLAALLKRVAALEEAAN